MHIVLTLALRYGQNYGVFQRRGNDHLETVNAKRTYVWTSDEEIQRRRLAGRPLPKVPEINRGIQ